MESSFLLAAAYLIASLIILCVFRFAAEKISKAGLRAPWVLAYLLVSIFWGASHLSIWLDGSLLFSSSPIKVVNENEILKWIAGIGALCQAACLPRHGMKHWLLTR